MTDNQIKYAGNLLQDMWLAKVCMCANMASRLIKKYELSLTDDSFSEVRPIVLMWERMKEQIAKSDPGYLKHIEDAAKKLGKQL